MQIPAYRDAIYRYKNETSWMAIIDLDEYIVPVEKNNLKDFLKDYEKYPAIVINWLIFDSNGLENREKNKTVIESFTRVHKNRQEEINRTLKTILKPAEVRYVSTHVSIYKNSRLSVDENFNNLCSETFFKSKNVSINKIRINHYHCKSKKEYIDKINKGFADRHTRREYIETDLNFKNTDYDYTILKYLEKLKTNITLLDDKKQNFF